MIKGDKYVGIEIMFNRLISLRYCSRFVPESPAPKLDDFKDFNAFLECHRKILVLTGAGVSTESGIPDYRSEKVGLYARSSYRPIQYQDFMKNSEARKRYWARNFVAWPNFKALKPNRVHFFIAHLQYIKRNTRLITQNVDGLHSKAGSSDILELHGNGYWVRCTNCKNTISRTYFQTILENENPDLISFSSAELRPDGDVELPDECVKDFKIPDCEKCGGILKPTVVFFGQSVPANIANEADKLVDNCDSVLILGTSLSTLSSFRLVEKAYDSGKFLCMINIGSSRADNMIDVRISGRISEVIFNVESRISDSELSN